MKFNSIILVVVCCLTAATFNALLAQQPKRDVGHFEEYKNEFYDSIKTESDRYLEEAEEPREKFTMDFSGYDLPESTKEFTQYWHNAPISQGWSGMCWCFAATSFFESEVYRLTGQKIKLSELYTVYHEYVEKARRFIRERGNSEFGQGSETNAVPNIWKKYGIVPAGAYTGLNPDQKFHDHRAMFEEMENYLNSLKESNAWNEEIGLSTIKSILNHYIGEPPSVISVDGKKMTPKEYLKEVVKLNLDDYVDIMSLKEKPYYKQVEYDVPDNWWNSDNYYNLPLDEFMRALKKTVRDGYTIAIGGDVSEPGYNSHQEVAMVPSFDIPSAYIDENSRQYRFNEEVTTDDHAIHLVGYQERNGTDWYLIKDSGSGSRNGTNPGYYFYHEDYIKLKIMNLMLHKSAVKEILSRFNK